MGLDLRRVRFECPVCGDVDQPVGSFTVGIEAGQGWWFTVCVGCNLPTGTVVDVRVVDLMAVSGCIERR